jgi:DNA-binding CsgD family transcriptional regulator
MGHLVFAAYMALFCASSAGIAALALGARIERGARFFLVLDALYGAGLALSAAYLYIGTVIGQDALEGLKGAFGATQGLIQAAVYGVAAAWIMSDEGPGSRQATPRGLSAPRVLALAPFAGAFYSLASASRTALAIDFWPWALPWLGPLAVLAAIGSLGAALLTRGAASGTGAMRGLMIGWGYSLLAFIPLSLAEWALGGLPELGGIPVQLDFLLYAALNAFAMKAFFGLREREAAARLGGEIKAEVAARYGLTPREREMLPLIARGLANKEIGAALGISEATARTHLYNLYKKLGARSRIEALRACYRE